MKKHEGIAISFAAAVFCTAVGIGLVDQDTNGMNLVAGVGGIAFGALKAFYFMRGGLHHLEPYTTSN